MNASRYDRDNQAPVLAYRVDYSKGEFDGFGFAGVHGKSFGARIDSFRGRRLLHPRRLDAAGPGRLGPHPRRRGQRRRRVGRPVGPGRPTSFTPRLKGTLRADYVKNDKNGGGIFGSVPVCDDTGACIADGRNGFGPKMAFDGSGLGGRPVGQGPEPLRPVAGLTYLFDLNTTFKVEYRLDGASGPAFIGANGSYAQDATTCSAPRWSSSF